MPTVPTPGGHGYDHIVRLSSGDEYAYDASNHYWVRTSDKKIVTDQALFDQLQSFIGIQQARQPASIVMPPSSHTKFTLPAWGVTEIEEFSSRTPEDLGMSIEPIIGYRDFTIDFDDRGKLCLYSRNHTVWPMREKLVASCDHNILAHDAPELGCECGIYAYSETHPPRAEYVQGEIYMWGKVFICDRGFRSEFAYPKRLSLRGQAKRIFEYAKELEESYGIPVEVANPTTHIDFG